MNFLGFFLHNSSSVDKLEAFIDCDCTGGVVFLTGKLVVLKRQLITSVEYTQCTICYIRDLFESWCM